VTRVRDVTADLLRHFGFHQLARDQQYRLALAQKILKPPITRLGDDVSNRHP
jgi:hypothetical protein